jgi:hypothetical protein
MCSLSIRWFLSKPLFAILFALIAYAQTYAQIQQPHRFEIALEGNGYQVVSAHEYGLFLLKEAKNTLSKETTWQVNKLDTTFNSNWERTYNVPNNYQLLSKYFDNGKLYFLFSKKNTKDKNLELISFDVDNGSAESFVIRNYIPFAFFDFRVANNTAIVAGYYSSRPIVILFDFVKGIPTVLPGLFGGSNELIQIKLNSNTTFDIILTGKTIDKNTTIFINTYSSDGTLLSNLSVNTEKSKGLLFGRSESIEDMGQLVGGVYGKNNSEYSRGIFLANINEFGEQQIKYYNYAEFKNFFNYMRNNREQRVRNRIVRKKIKGKNIKFNYRLLVHELIRNGDQYVLMGEAFYPKYINVSGNYSGMFTPISSVNNGMYQSSRVFDGYRYTHAVVLGFDVKGNLLWDNSFEINDVISFELEQFVHASITKDKIALLYVLDDHIRSKIISENDVLENKELIPIALSFDDDVIENESTEIYGLESWYDNVFYTYGTQKIKNLYREGVKISREVFFINKVIYK